MWELVAREWCRDTLAQYTHAGDRYLLDEYRGGVLRGRGPRDPRDRAAGRPAIIERFGGQPGPGVRRAGGGAPSGPRAAAGAEAHRAPQRHQHPFRVGHPGRGRSWPATSPSSPRSGSTTWVATATGWCPWATAGSIAHRFVSTDWRAPDTTFGGRPRNAGSRRRLRLLDGGFGRLQQDDARWLRPRASAPGRRRGDQLMSGSRGSPRMRSPIWLRLISDVPPAIDMPRCMSTMVEVIAPAPSV